MATHRHDAKIWSNWIPVALGLASLVFTGSEYLLSRATTDPSQPLSLPARLGPLGKTGLALAGLGLLVLLALVFRSRQDGVITLGAVVIVVAMALAICLL